MVLFTIKQSINNWSNILPAGVFKTWCWQLQFKLHLLIIENIARTLGDLPQVHLPL